LLTGLKRWLLHSIKLKKIWRKGSFKRRFESAQKMAPIPCVGSVYRSTSAAADLISCLPTELSDKTRVQIDETDNSNRETIEKQLNQLINRPRDRSVMAPCSDTVLPNQPPAQPQTDVPKAAANVLSAADLNKRMLYSIYRFKNKAPLHKYALNKFSRQQDFYTLAEILTELKELIKLEGMFDSLNPSVIICSPDLEMALDMKALHVTEIRELIKRQLIMVTERSNPGPNGVIFPPPNSNAIDKTKLINQIKQDLERERREEKLKAQTAKNSTITSDEEPSSSSSSTATNTDSFTSAASSKISAGVSSNTVVANTSGEGSATAAPAKPAGVRDINGIDNEGLREYIRSRPDPAVYADKSSRFKLKDNFGILLQSLPEFDPNKTDYSYDEVTSLLSSYILSKKTQLFDSRNIKVALVKDDPLGSVFGVNSFHRCQVTSLLRNQIVYLDPELYPEYKSTSSKRGEDDDGDGSRIPPFPTLMKAASMPAGTSVTSSMLRKRSPSGDSTGTQSKKSKSDQNDAVEPSSSSEEVEEEEEDDDEDGSETYEVEYEVESGEEENRPPQAGGGGNSSSDDSDVECKMIIEVEEKDEDCDNWADSEAEVGLQEPANFTLASEDKKECLRCGGVREPHVKYCSGCWEVRNEWTADRPNRPRTKKTKKARNERLALRVSEEDETDGGSGVDKHDSGVDKHDSGVSSQESIDSGERVANQEASAPPAAKVASSLDKAAIASNLEATKNAESREPTVGEDSKLTRSLSMPDSLPKMESGVVTSLCMFCCQRQKNASLIHGRLGHQVSCYPCAKRLWKEKARCPVCRRKIEKIVKIIMG